MKAVFRIIFHTQKNYVVMLGVWAVFAVIFGRRGSMPGGVVLWAWLGSVFFFSSAKWECTIRTMPVDGKKLLLGRYLAGVAGTAVISLAYALGCLLGGKRQFLTEVPTLLGCGLLTLACGFPVNCRYRDTSRRWLAAFGYAFAITILCNWLQERDYEIVNDPQLGPLAVPLPIPLEKGLIVLAISGAAMLISYFLSARMEANREW